MDSYLAIARMLSAAFVAGPFDEEGLVDRGSHLLGRRWLRPLARRLVKHFAGGPRPRPITVTKFILADGSFSRAHAGHALRVANPLAVSPMMCPLGVAESWTVPAIETAGDLASWLGISLGDLEWFADRRGLEYKRSRGRLRHYHYRLLLKRFGQIRLIEAPKPRLKEIQRQILAEILDQVTPHPAAHGFRPGRSIKSFAAPHVGKRVVLKLDLQDFFPSVLSARVQAVFRSIGYPSDVADLLTGLCVNTAPADVWEGQGAGPDRQLDDTRRLYSRPHLPQGAPTSPALANLCAYRMDCRLTGLAHAAGADYGRYADDLAFSGDEPLQRNAKRFQLHVAATVMQEGFSVHHRKTRIMRRGVRQRLVGVVVNVRLNVPRNEFDRLKATLTNCIRFGPQSQNRDAHHNFRSHLEGRISFVEMVNRSRGRRLRELFDAIRWSEPRP